MNVCIPVEEDRGPKSRVCAHFGSAPLFMIVDSETGSCRAITNGNQHHNHGMCTPLAALQGESFEAVVVGGIGAGALNKLLSAGIEVFLSDQSNVERTLAALKAGTLRPVTMDSACAQHGHGH